MSPSCAATSSRWPTSHGPASAVARSPPPSARRLARRPAGFTVAYRINDLKDERRHGRQRRRHRPDRHAGRFRARRRQPLHLPALRPDHRRGRKAGRGRDRRHPHRRPRLLDLLRALGRERQLHILLRGVRQEPGRSGSAQRPGRARPRFVLVGPHPDGQVQAAPERADGRPAPGPGRRRAAATDVVVVRGRRVSGTSGRRLRGRARRQAARGAVAGRKGPLPARASGLGAREDGAVLAEQLPGVRDLPGETRGRRRPAHMAGRPLAARLDRDGKPADTGPSRGFAQGAPKGAPWQPGRGSGRCGRARRRA